MKRIFGCAFTFCVVLFSVPTLAEQSARALLDKARDYVASAPVIGRVDTTEQSTVVIVDQRRKQREKTAMKLGTGPWEIPAGPFENMAKDMGNLFVCEIETPESKENAPKWKLTGMELLGGHEAFVIETEGNTAVALAQERMAKGIAKVFSDNPAQRPTVKVLEYSSKHWISKSDYRRLQAVQISKVQMTIGLPEGKQQLIESFSKATSKYSYDKVTIEIPEDARKFLSPGE